MTVPSANVLLGALWCVLNTPPREGDSADLDDLLDQWNADDIDCAVTEWQSWRENRA